MTTPIVLFQHFDIYPILIGMSEIASPSVSEIGTLSEKSPHLPVELEQKYLESRDQIKSIYQEVGLWHGMGRYRKKGDLDNLADIAEKGEIVPRLDHFDSKPVQSISLTKLRPWASIYADMHEERGHNDLVFKDDRKTYVGRLTLTQFPNLVRHARTLRRNGKTHARKWVESKIGEELSGPDARKRVRNFAHERTIVQGDYSILVGVKHDAFTPLQTAKYLQPTETRTDEPIKVDEITHIEVPLKFVEATKEILESHGLERLPVLPREFGERFQSEFTDEDLITGKGFAEPDFPKPEIIPSLEELQKYVPQQEWFTSPERAQSFYHGSDHLTRVLILQEILVNQLIASGKISENAIDREALRWSAMGHDIRRHSDMLNRGHADKAANWILQILPSEMPQEQKDKIFHIIEQHDRKISPNDPSYMELSILKDADALDRLRLERHMPVVFTPEALRNKVLLDPDRLKHESSLEMIPLANELYRLSTFDEEARLHDPVGAVFKAARQMGIAS